MNDNRNTYPKIPEIPDEIINAINLKRLVIFCGAGISKLLGAPLWDELAHMMVDVAYEDKRSGTRRISYSTKNQLLNKKYDAQKLLSIVYEIYDDDKDYFLDKICEKLEIDPKRQEVINKSEPLRHLISWNSSIITTNYDSVFEEISGDHYKTYMSCDEYDNDSLNTQFPFILHIHGSIKNKKNMVVTLSQYYEHYHSVKDEHHVKKILNSLFSGNYTVLFIGYSLGDSEIREYLQQKNKDEKEKDTFFILEPYSQTDIDLIKHLKKYYSSINVNMLPYFIDEDGYSTITEVISKWNEVLEKSSKLNYNKREQIETLISDCPSPDNLNQLISIAEKPSFRRYIFSEIHKSEKWIIPILNSDLFKISTIKKDLENDDPIAVNAIAFIYKILKTYFEDAKIKTQILKIISNIIESNICMFDNPNSNVFRHYCMDCIIMLYDEFIDSNFELIDKIKSLFIHDTDALIFSLLDNKDHFNELSIESEKSIMSTITTVLKNDPEFINSIQISDFYEEIIINLKAKLQGYLFEDLQNILIEITKNNDFEFGDIGSISEYLDKKYVIDYKSYYVKWFCKCMEHQSSSILEKIIETGLTSKNHFWNTISLHIINIKFAEFKNYILNLNTYEKLNYSELYDLIVKNMNIFNNDDIEKIINSISNTNFITEKETDQNKIYRYDLLKLFESKFLEDKKFKNNLEYNNVNNIENRMDISERGKLFHIESRWDDENHPSNTFDSFEIMVNEVRDNRHKYLYGDVKYFLKTHKDTIKEHLSELLTLPLEFQHLIYPYMENIDDSNIITYYSEILEIIKNQNPYYLGSAIKSYINWLKNTKNLTDAHLTKILQIIDSTTEFYVLKEQPQTRDLLNDALNNWYISSYFSVFSSFETEQIQQYTKELTITFHRILNCEFKNNKMLLASILAFRWDYFSNIFGHWMNINMEPLLYDHDNTSILGSYLYSNKYDDEIYLRLIENKQLLSATVTKTKEITLFCQNQNAENLAYFMTWAYFENKHEVLTLKSIEYCIECDICGRYVRGILIQINDQMEEKYESKITMLLESILNYTDDSADLTLFQQEINNYIIRTDKNSDLILSIVEVISRSNIFDAYDSLISSITDMELSDKLIRICKNYILNKKCHHYSDTFHTFANKIIQGCENKKDVVEMCNGMIEKGYEEYNQYLSNI